MDVVSLLCFSERHEKNISALASSKAKMPRKGSSKTCSAKGLLSGNWVIVVAGFALLLIGLTLTLRESWSSPSRYGGRVSGSNPGLDPQGPHRPPFSKRSLLLPYPSYEYSMDVAHNVASSVQAPGIYRHLNEPNVLSFLPQQAQRHPLRDVAPLTPGLSLQFARQHHAELSGYSPSRQRFYVKNRLGDPLYSVRPDYSVPTFGPAAGFRKVGIVYNPNHPDLKLPLFGRPKVPGGNRFDYYVLDDTPHANELPLDDHNGLELTTDDVVRIPGYDGDFFVYIYAYGTPFIGDQR